MSPGPPKQFDREEVLDKAMHVFWRQGFEATGMAQLVDELGVGRQSLYDTFGDKRGLFLEALAHYFRTQMGPVLALLRAPGSPIGNIRRVFQYWEQMEQREAFCGCLVGNACAELARRDSDIGKTIAGYFQALEDGFTDALTRAKEKGEISTDLPPDELARTLVHTVQGVALLSKVHQDPEMARSVVKSWMRVLGVAG